MGQIKRIQLRGISRTPSDRMTSDGGCAESLNVYLDNDEIAPVVKPEIIDIGIPEGTKYDKVFIHKTTYNENYIVTDSARVGYYKDKTYDTIFTLTDESVIDITTVGNTLVVATDKGMKYAVYKAGRYEYLGDSIPAPTVEFQSFRKYNGSLNTPYLDLSLYDKTDIINPNSLRAFNEEKWAQAIEDTKAGKNNADTQELAAINNEIWAAISSKVYDIRKSGAFAFPILARVAVKLYDGTYIYQTIPILLGAGHDKFAEITGNVGITDSVSTTYSVVSVQFTNAFNAKLYMRYPFSSGWSDIIKSVDVFVSTDICYPNVNSSFEKLELRADNSNVDEDTGFEYIYKSFELQFSNGGLTDLQAMEKELLSKSNFYKIASFAPSDLETSAWGYDLGEAMKNMLQDNLLTQDRLPDYEQSFSRIAPSRIFTVNNRVLAIGSQRTIAEGFGNLQSQNIVYKRTPDTTYQKYLTAYYITDAQGKESKIVYPSYLGEYAVAGEVSRPYGLMFHPDARCRKAEIFNEGSVYTVEMKPHPFLNCSYGYWGLSKQILDLTASQTGVSEADFFANENRMESDAQRLYVSPIDNPFYFPLSGNVVFSSNVIGVASAMMALSQGQFGQFPLYAFTDDGIWAMETNSAGDIISVKPLSREVCANADSITSIDASVVFMSDKGLTRLSGSEITLISPFMNGKHYVAEPSAETIIAGQEGFSEMSEILADSTAFMAFMKNAKIGYDYAGQRLVCINPDEIYQYVYKLDTQTWHKTFYGKDIIEPLNSYPRCEVATLDGQTTKILDLSTILDSSIAQSTEKGIIATRPFDLDEPDVLKTITDIRVRGQFQKGAVNMILLGSNDGINFYSISTLRGKAWKLFRLILLSKLGQHDRISWVDVMYDTKFTNRLR